MSKDEVVQLMKSSKSESDWDANCDKVKAAFDGDYPDFWFETFLVCGLMNDICESFGGSDEIRVVKG